MSDTNTEINAQEQEIPSVPSSVVVDPTDPCCTPPPHDPPDK
jgi:hypothetical protein